MMPKDAGLPIGDGFLGRTDEAEGRIWPRTKC